jgi:hypothetical protein
VEAEGAEAGEEPEEVRDTYAIHGGYCSAFGVVWRGGRADGAVLSGRVRGRGCTGPAASSMGIFCPRQKIPKMLLPGNGYSPAPHVFGGGARRLPGLRRAGANGQ